MLSRLPGNIPFSPIPQPSSDASGASGSGAASACAAAGSQAAPVALPAGGDGAIRDEARNEARNEPHEETTAQAAGSVHHDAEAAVAHRFWLPNDAWSSITEFLPRPDVLSLRTASHEIKLQVDDAIQSLRIRPEHLPRFLDSDSFKHLRNLDASLLDQAMLDQLITHLAAHPRPQMTISLGPPRITIDADTLLGLSALSLKGLVLELTLAGPDDLNALAACRFPVDLSAVGHVTHEQLVAASNLPTLRRLVTSSHVVGEELAERFAAHRALEALSIHIFRTTSPRTLQSLASVPTLREFHITAWSGNELDVPTAHALAANSSLESLKISSNGPGLNEEGFAALSRSQSLTTLRIPLRTAMLELANMKSVKNLIFDSHGTLPYPRLDAGLDAATSRSIAALPVLESIAFPIMVREPGALTVILRDGVARRLTFWNGSANGQDFFNADERTALMANTRLKAWEFFVDDLQGPDRDVLLDHPTIDFVKFGVTEFTRPPGSNATLTPRPI